MFLDRDFLTLVELSKKGSKVALNELLSRLQPYIKKFCNKFYSKNQRKNIVDFDDLLQEINLSIYKSISKLKCIKAFKYWFYRICHFCCIDFYRLANTFAERYPNYENDKNYLVDGEVVDIIEQLPCSKLSVDQILQARQDKEYLAKKLSSALNNIGTDFANTFYHLRVLGKKYDDYALEQGLKKGTVKSRVFRAMKLVQKEFEQDGIYRSDFNFANTC